MKAVSHPNSLALPFRTPATQASSVYDYRLITCLLNKDLSPPERLSLGSINIPIVPGALTFFPVPSLPTTQ